MVFVGPIVFFKVMLDLNDGDPVVAFAATFLATGVVLALEGALTLSNGHSPVAYHRVPMFDTGRKVGCDASCRLCA